MDKSWMGTNRTNKSYIDGVAAFIGNKQHLIMPCSCTKCLNHIEHKVEEVQFYLFKNRIDLSYTKWSKHGEKDEPSISAPKPVNATTEFVDDMDFASDIPTDSPSTVEMIYATKDNFDEDDLVNYDYPTLGTLCGCPFSGFKGCVVCGKDTNCVRLFASSKQSYVGHKQYLPYNHSFTKQKTAFNGQQEFLLAPNPMTEEQIYNENVAERLVKTLLNVMGKTKDGVNARLDLAKLGVKSELFSVQEVDKTTLPPASYTLTNVEKQIFCEMLYNIKVKRELVISKESVSETERWISYGPRAIVVKYDAYNINGNTFRTKCQDGKVFQNSGVSVEAIDLHISKEVATTRQAFYYGVLQEIGVRYYHFKKIPLFKCDWVNHRAGGVKHNTTLGYTLVDMFILSSQVRQVFYVKDQIDKNCLLSLRHSKELQRYI
nr:hypothetical protein [Tanacetum cinerariifolium]